MKYRRNEMPVHRSPEGAVFYFEDEGRVLYTLDFTFANREWMAWAKGNDRWFQNPQLVETFLALITEEERAACIAAAIEQS